MNYRVARSRSDTWVSQNQYVWEERSADPSLPKWFRVASLAWAMQGFNGHAPLPAGALADMLASVDTETGEISPDANVSRSIQQAVRAGLLQEGSSARCLIVPRHTFRSAPGEESARCSWCHSKRRGR